MNKSNGFFAGIITVCLILSVFMGSLLPTVTVHADETDTGRPAGSWRVTLKSEYFQYIDNTCSYIKNAFSDGEFIHWTEADPWVWKSQGVSDSDCLNFLFWGGEGNSWEDNYDADGVCQEPDDNAKCWKIAGDIDNFIEFDGEQTIEEFTACLFPDGDYELSGDISWESVCFATSSDDLSTADVINISENTAKHIIPAVCIKVPLKGINDIKLVISVTEDAYVTHESWIQMFSDTESEEEIEDTDSDVSTRTIKFNDDLDINLNWGWELFNKNASQYDHDLAMAGLILSQAAEMGKSEITSRYTELGFENVVVNRNYDAVLKPNEPAMACASKRICINGEYKYLLSITIRGTDPGTTDLWTDLSSQSFGFMNGFNQASDNVQKEFKQYYDSLNSYYSDYESPDINNTILFITGHSMGGAVAGLISKGMEDTYAAREGIFTYTFASANYETNLIDRESFTNIHNIINTSDLVPLLPTPLLGPVLGKNGHFWYYYWDSNNNEFQNALYKCYGHYFDDLNSLDKILQHDCRTYLAYLLSGLPENMDDGTEVQYSISVVCCPVDVKVLNSEGTILAQTEGSTVTYADNISVLVMTVDDEKYIIADQDTEYTIIFTGSGNGTMSYKQIMVSGDGQTVISCKNFSNVVIESGKLFSAHVISEDTENTLLYVVNDEYKVLAEVTEDGTEISCNETDEATGAATSDDNTETESERESEIHSKVLVIVLIAIASVTLTAGIIIAVILIFRQSANKKKHCTSLEQKNSKKMEQRFCPMCGSPRSSGATYCDKCGYKLDKSE